MGIVPTVALGNNELIAKASTNLTTCAASLVGLPAKTALGSVAPAKLLFGRLILPGAASNYCVTGS